MKITWVSPHGDGWSIAHRLREAGNKVVYFCPERENKNGSGYLPQVTEAGWMGFAERSDLVVVDSNFASRRTRRSWEPSEMVFQLQQLRHKNIPVLGPTPTTELLENDPRYLRKVLRRLGLNPTTNEGIPVTVSADPDGRCYLVFRHRTLLGDGNGPEVGNLGDVVIPVPRTLKLVKSVIDPLAEFTQRVGYHGYLNADLSVVPTDFSVQGAQCRFIYPAIFAQFADLLGPLLGVDGDGVSVGLAVTLLRLDDNSPDVSEQLPDAGGFFGRDIYRHFDGDRPVASGEFLGAVVGRDVSWNAVQDKVNSQLSRLVRPGWGFRANVGDNVFAHLQNLRSWGWIDA